MANARVKTASFGPGFLGAVIIFCAFAVVAWILFAFAAPGTTNEDKRADNRKAKAAAIAKEAVDKLYGAPTVDKTKGTVQLPINVAMDLVVNDYQSKQPHASAVKVENPYPAGLQPPAAAAAASPATTGSNSGGAK